MARVNIEPLPPNLRSYLRTGVSITSVTQCVEELVLNSVDACASCIAVRIDLSCFKVQVVDNGDGIPHDQLDRVGNRFCTSKCHTLSDIDNLCHYGYRGEALASIVDSCGTFEIVTRSKIGGQTYSKVFTSDKTVKICQSSKIRPSVGTTMTVHQLFLNFPVRQKSMNQSHELGRLRETLEGIALVNSGISFSLRNDSTGQVILSTKKCPNICRTFSQLYGAAKANALIEVSGSNKSFKVHGYLGRDGHQRKNLQFVYVNGRLVKKSKIHKLLKKMLLNLPALKPKLRPLANSPKLSGAFFSTPPKFSEAYPVYVLEVDCPLHEYDITFDPAKTMVEFKDWDTLLSCVSEVTESFLKNESITIQTSPVLKTAFVEDEEKEDVPVICADNLKDVLISKVAKHISNECKVDSTEPSVEIIQSVSKTTNEIDHDVFKTPRNSEAVICKAAIGLGIGDIDNYSKDDDGDKSILDESSTASSMNDTVNTQVRETELNNEVDAAGDRDKTSNGTIDQSGPYRSHVHCSLSSYRESIGKSTSLTRCTSVDESLQKLHHIFPSSMKVHSNRIVSSLQKFRSKFAPKGNPGFHTGIEVEQDHSAKMPNKGDGYRNDEVEAITDDYNYQVCVQSPHIPERFEMIDKQTRSISDSDDDSDFDRIENNEKRLRYINSIPNIEPMITSFNANVDLRKQPAHTSTDMVMDDDTPFVQLQKEKETAHHMENLGKRSANTDDSHDIVSKKQCRYFARPHNGSDNAIKVQLSVISNGDADDTVCNINDCDKLTNTTHVQKGSVCDNSTCDNDTIDVVDVHKSELNDYHTETDLDTEDKSLKDTYTEILNIDDSQKNAVDRYFTDFMNSTQAFTPHLEQELNDTPVMSDEAEAVVTPESFGFTPKVHCLEALDSPGSTGFDIAVSAEDNNIKSDSVSDSSKSLDFKSTFSIIKESVQSVSSCAYVENNSSKSPATIASESQVANVFTPEWNTPDCFDMNCDSVSITQLMKSPTLTTTQLDSVHTHSGNNDCFHSFNSKAGSFSEDLFCETPNELKDVSTVKLIKPTDVDKSIDGPDVESSPVTYELNKASEQDHIDAEEAGTCNRCSWVNDNSDVVWSDCSWDPSEISDDQLNKQADKTDTISDNKECCSSNYRAGEDKLVIKDDDNGKTICDTDVASVHDVDDKNQAPEISQTVPEKAQSAPSDLDVWFQNLDKLTDMPGASNVLQTDKPSHVVKKLHACRFSKQSLKSVKVLGQVDKKFIACLINTETDTDFEIETKTMFILIDQHAAHERIRLEILTEEAFEDGSRGGKLTMYTVDEPQCLSFTEDEVRIIMEFKENYMKLGIDLERISSTSLLIKTIPECLVYKEKNRIYWSTIQVLMREYLSVFMSTTASHGVLPQTIHKVLCSLACHGAIKFGDRLSQDECTKLINDLSLCDLPFQCAHGRPSVMPLFDMDKLKPLSQTQGHKRPNLQKLKRKLPT